MAVFGSNKNTTPTTSMPTTSPDGGLTCVIAPGTVITGTFTSTENVRLDGEIEGKIIIDRKLVLGEKARIKGNVKASSLVVNGKLDGNLDIAETLHIQSTADVTGDMNAKSLIVEEGGKYNGKLNIGGTK